MIGNLYTTSSFMGILCVENLCQNGSGIDLTVDKCSVSFGVLEIYIFVYMYWVCTA